MDRDRIKAQAGLLKQFADRNRAHIGLVAMAPDCSEITVELVDVPLVYRDSLGRLSVGRKHTLRFAFDNQYPKMPPVFSIGPHRPVCSHIWRNGTICLLQPVWYEGFELPSGIIDLVGMLQGEEQIHGGGANADDSHWLSDKDNFRRRREMVGTPTRFVGLSWNQPVVRQAPPARPAIRPSPPTRPAIRPAQAVIGGGR